MENGMSFVIGKTFVMAMIEIQSSESKGTKRKIHFSPKIDMTPMVDLGFLLITFFILTTSMLEKKAMKLYMPADGNKMNLGASKVLTILLSQHNQAFAYEGKFDDALKESRIIATSYSESNGIGNLIRQKQKKLQAADKKDGRDGLVLLIKPATVSTYKNVVDALDEATINGVKKYMVVDPEEDENVFIKKTIRGY